MNAVEGSDVIARQRALAVGGLLAFGNWFEEEGTKKRPLVLFGCDEVASAVDIADLHINLDRKSVTWRDHPIILTAAEFRILCCLVQRPGVFLPSRQIYDAVHGVGHHVGVGHHGHCNATRVHIKRIRRKFRAADGTFDQIETWYSHGYRWRAEA